MYLTAYLTNMFRWVPLYFEGEGRESAAAAIHILLQCENLHESSCFFVTLVSRFLAAKQKVSLDLRLSSPNRGGWLHAACLR